jgi:hypothetical protein
VVTLISASIACNQHVSDQTKRVDFSEQSVGKPPRKPRRGFLFDFPIPILKFGAACTAS